VDDTDVVTEAKPAPPRSAAYVEANQAVDGHLVDLLKSWRDQGLSYDAIAGELRDRHVIVTGASVRNWCVRLLVAS
jgi:hypothetical protein